jgi:hypothetical protein
MRKILLATAALAALAVPASAQAVNVPVNVTIVPVADGQYAWTCEARANPLVVTNFNLWCNNEQAVGVAPAVKAAAGVSSTPTVCWSTVFWFKGGVASDQDCVTL